MRKNLFILSMFLLVVGIVSAQERYQDTEFFTKEVSVKSNDTIIYLYEKGNYTLPKTMQGHSIPPGQIILERDSDRQSDLFGKRKID